MESRPTPQTKPIKNNQDHVTPAPNEQPHTPPPFAPSPSPTPLPSAAPAIDTTAVGPYSGASPITDESSLAPSTFDPAANSETSPFAAETLNLDSDIDLSIGSAGAIFIRANKIDLGGLVRSILVNGSNGVDGTKEGGISLVSGPGGRGSGGGGGGGGQGNGSGGPGADSGMAPLPQNKGGDGAGGNTGASAGLSTTATHTLLYDYGMSGGAGGSSTIGLGIDTNGTSGSFAAGGVGGSKGGGGGAGGPGGIWCSTMFCELSSSGVGGGGGGGGGLLVIVADTIVANADAKLILSAKGGNGGKAASDFEFFNAGGPGGGGGGGAIWVALRNYTAGTISQASSVAGGIGGAHSDGSASTRTNGWAGNFRLMKINGDGTLTECYHGNDAEKFSAGGSCGSWSVMSIVYPVASQFITPSNQSSIQARGHCDRIGSQISFAASGVTLDSSATCNGSGWVSPNLDFKTFPDGAMTFTATIYDGARTSAASVELIKDTTPPTVAIGSWTYSGLNPKINSGYCSENNRPVMVYMNGSKVAEVPCNNNNFSTEYLYGNVSIPGTLTLVAKQTDAAGNTGVSMPRSIQLTLRNH